MDDVNGAEVAGDGNDEIVMVPVPRRLLASVYGLLARSMIGKQDPAFSDRPTRSDGTNSLFAETPCPRCRGPALVVEGIGFQCSACGLAFKDPSIAVDRDNGIWTRSMVNLLRLEFDSNSNVVRALDYIAQRAPDAVSSDELSEAIGVESHQFRSELAALSKAARRLFGRKIWPMSARQGWGQGDRMGYRMPEELAEWWLHAAHHGIAQG